MRKLKLLIALCMVTIAASASKTVYLSPSVWATDDARFALYMFTDGVGNAWADFTDTDNDGIFTATCDDSYEKMIIVRMDKNNSTTAWNDNGGTVWNQTQDIVIPAIEGLTYVITDWDNDGGKSGYKMAAYIYNKDADLFFTRGNDWGTQAVGAPVGLPWKFELNDGKYTLRMYDINNQGATGNGYGDNNFTDNGSPLAFTIEGDATNGYTIKNGDNYINCPATAGVMNFNSTSGTWKFLTQAQYKAVLADRATAQEAQIATLKGVTIPDGSTFSDVVADANNWAVSATVDDGAPTSANWTATKHSNRGGNTNWGDYGSEMYQCGDAHYTRTITGLKQGVYKVSVRAMKRVGTNGNCYSMGQAGFSVSDSYMKANGYIIPIKAWYDDCVDDGNPNSTGAFVNIANNGGYTTEGFVYVGSDGKLDLDVASEAYWNYSWFLFNGISYTYYNNEVSSDDATAILATANGIKDSKMQGSVKTALTEAISTFDGNRTIANYNALNTAISNANASIDNYAQLLAAINSPIYTAAFEAGTTLYNGAIAAAQAVYDAAEVSDCTDAITALTNGLHAAYESDYGIFASDYEYDYSTLLSNDLTKWATSDYVVMNGNQHWKGGDNVPYYEQSGTDWNSSAWSHAASETATLPAGKYVMSITARSSAAVTSTMSVKIGDNAAATVVLAHKGDTGRGVTTDGVGSFADDETYCNGNIGRGWEYRFIAFELTEESNVTISFNSSTDKQYNWVSIANPLLKGNVHPKQIKLNQVHSLTATLKGYEGYISDETYATFANDIAAGEAATLESTDLDAIITALEADIETAKAEKVIFDRGAAMNALNTGDNSVVLTEEATAANWTPTPTLNTWSTEADNTGMVTPFLQNWKNRNDGALADNTETYVPIRGLKKGYYEVSALVRIYSESGSEPSATYATFTANGTSVSLLDGTNFDYNNMKGVYKTARVVVYTEDALNISLAYSGANFNWIAWKDLKVTYLTENAAPVYAVVGSAPFFTGNWDQATQTDIMEGSDGVYTKTYANQTLDAQTIEYKVIKKDLAQATVAGAWYSNNGDNNSTISIPVKGIYDITFTFTEEGSVVEGVATKTAEAVTIGEKGWATTVTNSALDFSASEVKAYTAKVVSNAVQLTKVDDVQAETGLVLKGTEGTYYIPVIAESETDKGSLMHSSTDSYWTWHNNGGENNTFYGLTVNASNEAQFVKIACSADNEVEIPAGKAFLLINSANAARELKVVFAGETTGIDAVVAERSAESVYNLNGQRVAAPAKGLYIVNGKKVILK